MQEPTLHSFLSQHKGGFSNLDSFAGVNLGEMEVGESGEAKPIPPRVAKEMLFWIRRVVREAEQIESRCLDRPRANLQGIFLVCRRYAQVLETYGLDTLVFEEFNDKEVFLELQNQVRLLEARARQSLDPEGLQSIISFLVATKLGDKLNTALDTMNAILGMENPEEFIRFAARHTVASLQIEDELKYMTRSGFGSAGKETYEEWCVKKELAVGLLDAVLPVVRELLGGEVTSQAPAWMTPKATQADAKENTFPIAMEDPKRVTDEIAKWVQFREDFIIFLLSVTGETPE